MVTAPVKLMKRMLRAGLAPLGLALFTAGALAQTEVSVEVTNRTSLGPPGTFPPAVTNPDLVESPRQFGGATFPGGGNRVLSDGGAAGAATEAYPSVVDQTAAPDGLLVLRRSTIGAAFISLPPQFFLGDVITRPEVDGNGDPVDPEDYYRREPVRPGEDVFVDGAFTRPVDEAHVEAYYWSPHAEKVFASQAGRAVVTWRSRRPIDEAGNFDVVTRTYVISTATQRNVKKLYWTEKAFKGPLIDIPQGRVTLVNIVYSAQFPERVDEEFRPIGASSFIDPDDPDVTLTEETRTMWFSVEDRTIHAYNLTGRVFVEFLADDGDGDDLTYEHLGFEVVEVAREARSVALQTELGDYLRPVDGDESLFPSPVQTTTTGEQAFLARHFANGGATTRYYGVRENEFLNQVLVYWLQAGELGILWPKYLHSYWLRWPEGLDDYSLYAQRTDGETPPVRVPTVNNTTLVYQDDPFAAEATLDPQSNFLVRYGPGDSVNRSLLLHQLGGKVWYERVYSQPFDEVGSGAAETATIADRDGDGTRDRRPTSAIGEALAPPVGAGQVTGYIVESEGDAYNVGTYIDPFEFGFDEAALGRIIPVNALAGNDELEVWWFRETVPPAVEFKPVYWPSLVERHTIEWPAAAREIVMASNEGTGELDGFEAKGRIYFQNDPGGAGYNPNEEHAVMLAGRGYALRDDLNTAESSEPYVLIDYEDAAGAPAMAVFKVLREKPEEGQVFRYEVTAGTPLQAPMPLPVLPLPLDEEGVTTNREVTPGNVDEPGNWSGLGEDAKDALDRYRRFTFVDRKQGLWVYRGPHDPGAVDPGAPPLLQMQYRYKTQASFAFPGMTTPPVGTIVPYLRPVGSAGPGAGAVRGTPLTIDFVPVWPEAVPELRVGETLTLPKFGLPAVRGQTSAAILYQQSVAADVVAADRSAVLHDPTRPKIFELSGATLDQVPASVATTTSRGLTYFQNLPPHLKERLWMDPNIGDAGALVLVGRFVDEVVGEHYLLLNVLSDKDLADVRALCDGEDPRKAAWDDVVGSLSTEVETFVEDPAKKGTFIVGESERVGVQELAEIGDSDTAVDSYALTAAGGNGTGYVTLATGDGEAFTPEGEPVSLHVFRVSVPLYRGQLKVVASANPLDEKLTLQHTGDFAGFPGDYEFEWKYLPPVDGQTPVLYELTRELLVGDGLWDTARNPVSWPVPAGGYAGAVDLPNSVVISDGDGVDGGLPSLVLKRELGLVLDEEPLRVYLSADLGTFDGFILTVNGVEGLVYNVPGREAESAATLPELPGDFNPLAVIFQLDPRLFRVGGANRLEIGLFTTADAGHASDLNFRLEGVSENDLSGSWTDLDAGPGKNRHTIEGSSLLTLTDNFVTMRYRARDESNPTWTDDGEGGNGGWSRWMEPQLAEGWIKRVLAGINPFNQRVTDLFNNTVNTDVSLLTQAGPRWEGDIPLSLANIDDFGLIEIYETVFRRGKQLSIDGAPAIDYGPANDALLLAAGYLNDLYMQLGNEAFADAANPTIAFDTENGEFSDIATSLFAFKGQQASLLDEELALLRGRDDFLAPGVELSPAYNRLFWNYTRGLDSGEVIYALNYNIRERADEQADGVVDAADAQRMFPQGHGDALGHYLSALKYYYGLLTDDEFTWAPRTEQVTVLGQGVQVDYLDERKFATAAAALARTTEQVFDLTWRQVYDEGEDGGWDSFGDGRFNSRTGRTREWGLDEWAARGTQGAYLNWVVGNAVLPEVDPDPTHEGILKIDRTTVPELGQLVSAGELMQLKMDNANARLNPLGLSPRAVSFDISPSELAGGKTHFEQVYERSLTTLENAVKAFDNAKDSTRYLRVQEGALANLEEALFDQERAFKQELIHLYGRPYAGDIGPGKPYAAGYDGPDLLRFMFIDRPSQFFTLEEAETVTLTYDLLERPDGVGDGAFGNVFDDGLNPGATVSYEIRVGEEVQFMPGGNGRRASVGEIQGALLDIHVAAHQLDEAIAENAALYLDVERQIDYIEATVVAFLRGQTTDSSGRTVLIDLVEKNLAAINNFKFLASSLKATAELSKDIGEVVKEGLPKVNGLSNDATSVGRSIALGIAITLKFGFNLGAAGAEKVAGDLANQIELEKLKLEDHLSQIAFGLEQEKLVYDLEAAFNALLLNRYAIDGALQRLQGARERYQTLLADGQWVQAERETFRKRAAALVQGYRVRDVGFRVFRNEALEQYKTLFDLANRYAYLAGKAYDYETGLLGTEDGKAFLGGLVSTRSLGVVEDGVPRIVGSEFGDPGLSSSMAKLAGDWSVVRTRMGFNNPAQNPTTFSLRTENFRFLPTEEGDENWEEMLQAAVVDDLLADPDIVDHCLQIDGGFGLPVPGIVIPFSTTVEDGKNFFGRPLAGGDHTFSPSNFATKIWAVGVSFEGYVGMDPNYLNGGEIDDPALVSSHPDALSATPYVYLILTGSDLMRSPPLGDPSTIRTWNVHDQALPLPFNLSDNAFSENTFWQAGDTLFDDFLTPRKHRAFRAVDDITYFYSFFPDDYTDKRLVGRSVWNTQWKLVVPAKTLHSNPDVGLDRFLRTVRDIKLFLRTYSYSGN